MPIFKSTVISSLLLLAYKASAAVVTNGDLRCLGGNGECVVSCGDQLQYTCTVALPSNILNVPKALEILNGYKLVCSGKRDCILSCPEDGSGGEYCLAGKQLMLFKGGDHHSIIQFEDSLTDVFPKIDSEDAADPVPEPVVGLEDIQDTDTAGTEDSTNIKRSFDEDGQGDEHEDEDKDKGDRVDHESGFAEFETEHESIEDSTDNVNTSEDDEDLDDDEEMDVEEEHEFESAVDLSERDFTEGEEYEYDYNDEYDYEDDDDELTVDLSQRDYTEDENNYDDYGDDSVDDDEDDEENLRLDFKTTPDLPIDKNTGSPNSAYPSPHIPSISAEPTVGGAAGGFLTEKPITSVTLTQSASPGESTATIHSSTTSIAASYMVIQDNTASSVSLTTACK